MASMVPDRLPRAASAGEKRMFAVLEALGEETLVCYEPILEDRYPDFVVIEPSIGVFVIEVKGLRLGEIRHVDDQDIRFRQAGQERTAQHPARQAREYMHRLMRQAERNPVTASVLIENGRFGPAFGRLVLLSQIRRAELEASPWARFFPPGSTVCRDELPGEDEDDAESVRAMLRAALPAEIVPRPLDQPKVDALRAVIHPQAVLGDVGDGKSLKLLDVEQEQAAASVGDGHRIFYGVPGSGKTVMLIARARLLAEAGRRVLFLCFNKALRSDIADALAGCPRVDVVNFHAWAHRQGARLDFDDHEACGRNLLDILASGEGESGTYDAVLVDEGQDFSPSWFTCATLALEEPEDGDLVIAYDLSQRLYERAVPVWSRAGVKARGRTAKGIRSGRGDDRRFLRNYRNTREIARLAAAFGANAGDTTEAAEDAPHKTPLDPDNCARSGAAPLLNRYGSLDEEVRACADLVGRLVRDGTADGRRYARDQIAVLSPWKPEKLPGRLSPELHDIARRLAPRTIHSAKGLQWPVVIVIGAGHLWPEDPALLYVACTRPEELLAVSWSRATPLTERLARHGTAVPA